RGLDDLLLGRHVDPATLAAQVAAIDDRHVQKRREHLPAPEPLLVLLHGKHALPPHVPGELPQEPLVGFKQKALGHFPVHRCLSLSCARQRASGTWITNARRAEISLSSNQAKARLAS